MINIMIQKPKVNITDYKNHIWLLFLTLKSKQPPLKTVALGFRLAPKGHHIDFYNLGSIITMKLNTDAIYLKSVFANLQGFWNLVGLKKQVKNLQGF